MVKPNLEKPVILSLFNDDNDFKIEQLDEENNEIKTNINKVIKQYDNIDTITSWPCQNLILDHFKCEVNKVSFSLGVKDYSKKEYSELEKTAFRKYYQIPKDKKVVISYGEYDYSKGLDVFEAVARILPDYEFFFLEIEMVYCLILNIMIKLIKLLIFIMKHLFQKNCIIRYY